MAEQISPLTQPEALGFCFVGQELRLEEKKTHFLSVQCLTFSMSLFSYLMTCEHILEDSLIDLHFFFMSYVTRSHMRQQNSEDEVGNTVTHAACGKVHKHSYACTEHFNVFLW